MKGKLLIKMKANINPKVCETVKVPGLILITLSGQFGAFKRFMGACGERARGQGKNRARQNWP